MIETLYESFSGPLRRFAGSLTRNDDLAEDLVQETFSRAVANGELLRIIPPARRKAWLFSVLKNLHVDRWRRERFERPGEMDREVPENPLLEEGMDSVTFLAALPDRLRTVVVQTYWLGRTSEEIGRGLGIPAATVRTRLHAAHSLLKKKFHHTERKKR